MVCKSSSSSSIGGSVNDNITSMQSLWMNFIMLFCRCVVILVSLNMPVAWMIWQQWNDSDFTLAFVIVHRAVVAIFAIVQTNAFSTYVFVSTTFGYLFYACMHRKVIQDVSQMRGFEKKLRLICNQRNWLFLWLELSINVVSCWIIFWSTADEH